MAGPTRTVITYTAAMQDLENQLGLALGSSLPDTPKDSRVQAAAITALLGAVIKWIIDNDPVLNETQLQATIAAAKVEPWTNLPI
jgi:hypothetical protein